MKLNRFVIIGVMLSSITPALAQIQITEYVLKITPAEADLLGTAIGNLPYKDAVPLMNKLRSQIIEQQPKPTTDTKPEPNAATPAK